MLPIFLACNSSEVEKSKEPIKQNNIVSVNSEEFNTSFSLILKKYYQLKNTFIKEDVPIILKAASELKLAADSLKLNLLSIDSVLKNTAIFTTKNLSDEVVGLIGETNIENMRKSFQIITSDIYDLVRIVKYDKDVIYLQHCPMAFNNKGADWLSNVAEIENPYLPKQMLDCGEVKDSVDYRKYK